MKRGGSFMSKELREELAQDPEYSRCSLQGHGECGGRITREHALIHAGKKIQERWAIIPLCAKHHNVDEYQDDKTMVKEMNVWVALNRATDEELFRYSKAVNYIFVRERLNKKYGVYNPPPIPSRIPNTLVYRNEWEKIAQREILSLDPAMAACVVTKSPIRRLTKDELFAREVKAYARTNGCSIEEATEILTALA